MIDSSPLTLQHVLDSFFAGHNDASPEDVPDLVELFRTRRVAILPFRRGAARCWYGFSTDARKARELRNELLAFVGPTWSRWAGASAELDPREPIEGLLAAVCRGPVVRLECIPDREVGLEQSIHLLANMLMESPPVSAQTPRPRHRILSELELAFAVRNERRAKELIEEITATGVLGAINLLFLQIRLSDAAGDTQAILSHPDLPDILRRQRPHAVTLAVARAVQTHYLSPFEEAWRLGDPLAPTAALESFGQLSADYQSIFSDLGLTSYHELAPAVVAHHLMRGDEDRALALVESVPSESQQWPLALITGIAPAGQTPAAPSVVEEQPVGLSTEARMSRSFDAGDYKAVLDIAQESPSTAVSLDYAVRAAYNLDTLAAAEQVLALLASAENELLEHARRDRTFRDTEKTLRTFAPMDDAVIASWREWFDAVAEAPDWTGSEAVAERGHREWSPNELIRASDCEALAAAILRCANNDDAHSAALGGLVHFVEWLDGAAPGANAHPVVGAALDLLLYAADSSEDRDSLSIRLFAMVAGLAPDESDAARRLRDFAELWNDVAAPRRLDWPLALLDVAIDFFGRADSVKAFLAAVLASVGLWPDRVDQSQVLALKSMASDLGEQEAITTVVCDSDDRSGQDPLLALAGKSIGIYTLTPGAGSRAARVLRDRCPTASVQVNGDLVSTEGLRALARRADIMVVAFHSAKHAATGAIVAIRGRSGVVSVRGKGSVGILRSLEDWALGAAT